MLLYTEHFFACVVLQNHLSEGNNNARISGKNFNTYFFYMNVSILTYYTGQWNV
jgi:hypothetical protein